MNLNKTDILLIEDNADDAGLTIRALRKNNVLNTIIHLSDGEEALNYIFCEGEYHGRNHNELPRLILLDLKMPKVDGLEVLKRVKSDVKTKNIPIIILTSSNENADVEECYRMGANSYLVKPVEFDGYLQAIGTLSNYWLQLNQYPQ
ncbi:MAG TPA: response regulator [Sphingobacteriaceae bacterium]